MSSDNTAATTRPIKTMVDMMIEYEKLDDGQRQRFKGDVGRILDAYANGTIGEKMILVSGAGLDGMTWVDDGKSEIRFEDEEEGLFHTTIPAANA